jgi:alginate O-acetyltransferase complex protein AlgI
MIATMIAMTIAGVWHGGSWCYVLWGVWHGLGLVVNQTWRKYKPFALPSLLCWPITTAFVLAGFVLFRAQSVSTAVAVLHSMFLPAGLTGAALREMTAGFQPARLISMLAGAALLFYPLTASQVSAQTELRPRFALAMAACAFLCILVINSRPAVDFIYRQF